MLARLESAEALKILVADDSATDRLILETIVSRNGHIPVGVADGQQAVAAFERERPDIVLLDVLMPVMGGIAAAQQIRAKAGSDFVPIIFLTALNNTESLIECLEAGGDDFIPKPYNQAVLTSKLRSYGRMRTMHRTMQLQKEQIEEHNRHLIQEQTVAKQVFDNVAHSGCLDLPIVRHYMSGLAVFNGDVLVAETSPSGNVVTLLGDFTGHGLPAAIGSMPLASTFYGMVRKGFKSADVLREINKKLNEILPTGFFCCAILVEIDFVEQRMRVWNGGMPDAFLYRRKEDAYESISSKYLPLGVLNNKQFSADCQVVNIAYGDRVYLWTDGAYEGRNANGEMFGEERLYALLANNKGQPELFDSILNALHRHIGESKKEDDISLLELSIEKIEIAIHEREDIAFQQGGLQDWQMEFELQANTLKAFDPLPLLGNILDAVPGLRAHRSSLYTVLSELYANALEHGVLGLSSALKVSPEGFVEYYEAKRQALKGLTRGFVHFSIRHTAEDRGGLLQVRVKDSGEGFDPASVCTSSAGTASPGGAGDVSYAYHGRGLRLMRAICEELVINEPGNDTQITFRWSHDD